MSYNKYFKPTLHAKFGDDRRQYKKKLWPLRVNFLHFRKFTSRQKYPSKIGD